MRRYVIVLTVGLLSLGIGSSVRLCRGIKEMEISDCRTIQKMTGVGSDHIFQSPQRNINVNELIDSFLYVATDEDISNLELLVEAEAGGEDYEGKLLVANVVLNRVRNDDFPDTITEVIFQRNAKTTQFSPVGSGKIYRVTAGDETKQAVLDALEGADVSEGALYFAARKLAAPEKMKWFDQNLFFLFRHGGHDFFR